MTLLKLDFDGPLPRHLESWVTTCATLWGWRLVALRIDRTRHGYHVVVGVEAVNLGPAAVVAAQAILGSDPKREAFNLMRVGKLATLPAFWRSRWNVLYATHRHGVRIRALDIEKAVSQVERV